MKKIWIYIFTVFSVFACKDEIQFNMPALQGIKDGVELWRATYSAADIDAGGLVVQGGNNSEVLSLVTTRDNVGTYYLGGNYQSEARFEDAQGNVFSTLNPPDPSVSIYPADGEIVIVDFENSTNTVTGTFKFNAYTADGLQTVNFIEGEFYQIRLTGGLLVLGGGTSCQDAVSDVADAEAAFAATDSSMPEYEAVCNAYKDALTVQIFSCGDSTGALQSLVDSLGDCN
ncbi:MAG: hypothetical protein HKN00_02510 [Flavobacteriaceae bacterium]|nr:hypothetical protein [Bacteroidia bacterium]NNF74029.1 hypothetical protein [Flavobacteriaceae bacterium]